MGTAAYGGKGFKERTRVSGERPMGADSFRQQSIQASSPPRYVMSPPMPPPGVGGGGGSDRGGIAVLDMLSVRHADIGGA